MKSVFIIAPLGNTGTETRKRAEYLENQIRIALEPLGLNAQLILSAAGKERITEYMIKRLSSDILAVAILDDYNRNVMYEIAIRHALCLPTLHIIEEGSGRIGKLTPFDIRDVEISRYPKLIDGKWNKKNAHRFRVEVHRRAKESLTAPASGLFRTGLRRASALATLEAIFRKKRAEIAALEGDIRDSIGHLERLYPKDAVIYGKDASDQAGMLDRKLERLRHTNDTLLAIAEDSDLHHLESRIEQCKDICTKIRDVINALSSVVRALRVASEVQNFADAKNPSHKQKKLVSQLKNIVSLTEKLKEEIVALLESGTI